jgi:hypothetical protein
VNVLLGNGLGALTLASTTYAPTPKGLAVHDFDGDSHPDVVVSDTDYDRVLVFRGTGTGTLLAAKSHQVGDYPVAVDIADFTLDGRPDIVSADTGSRTLTVLVNIGGGDFNFAHSSPVSLNAQYLAAGDLDGDGRSDVVSTYYGYQTVQSHIAAPFGSWDRYCTAKVTSEGCEPVISATGTPSASNVRPFWVRTYGAVMGTPALYFYKVNGAQIAQPFQGGTLCIGGPGLRRSPVFTSGGDPKFPCTGVLLLDFNRFAAGLSGGTPDPALSVAGVSYLVQMWGRDPASSPFQTSLSNALHVEVGP